MALSTTTRRDGFKARSGCFECGICGRATRRTSSGNTNLCPQCDEASMAENAISDYGDEMSAEELAGQEARIKQLYQQAVDKGGVIEGYTPAGK